MFWCDTTTPPEGEPHCKLEEGKERLGQEVIVDAYLMALADVFVHGNSNVANFVLCKNSKLRHEDIFDFVYHDLKAQ